MKILVGYDGSDPSKAAVELAKVHAKAFDAKIHLITSLIKGTENELKAIGNAEDDLARQKKILEDGGIKCETHLLIRGLPPGEDMVEFAKEKQVDEIIIGIKHRSKVGKFVFGSNAQYVILKAPCPVLTVK